MRFIPCNRCIYPATSKMPAATTATTVEWMLHPHDDWLTLEPPKGEVSSAAGTILRLRTPLHHLFPKRRKPPTTGGSGLNDPNKVSHLFQAFSRAYKRL